MKDKSPNFLLVGGAKCGSTSLYHLLNQHPDIFMPDFKEPLYFISEVIKNINVNDKAFRNEGLKNEFIHSKSDYLDLFRKAESQRAIGEASATYLYYHSVSIPKIKNELGDPKIIIILRNPVEKAFSQYKHLQKLSAEDISFEDSLKLEENRIRDNYSAMYHYRSQCLYFEQVRAFCENFTNVQVVLTDDLKKDPLNLAKSCYDFLEVDNSFVPDVKVFNVSSNSIRFRTLHKIIYSEKSFKFKLFFKSILGKKQYEYFSNGYRSKNIRKIEVKLQNSQKVELKEYFEKDLEKLENYLNRDLSFWKS